MAKELKNNSQNTKPESGSAQTEDNSATPTSDSQPQASEQQGNPSTPVDGSNNTPITNPSDEKPANEVLSVTCQLKKGNQRRFTDREFWNLPANESRAIEWVSTDNTIVEIKKTGVKGFEGKAIGDAIITGKKDGQVKYEIVVTVIE